MPKLSIISIHKGEIFQLQKTIDSIYKIFSNEVEHILVANLEKKNIEKVKKLSFRSKTFFNMDSSLYDAMNIGLSKMEGDYVIFINSGDSIIVDELNLKILKDQKCYIFNSTLIIDDDSFTSNKTINHQNFIAPRSKLKFDESYGVYSDAKWIDENIKKFGFHKIDKTLASFSYGGCSTRPNLLDGIKNFRFDIYIFQRIKFLFKGFFLSVGLESINKYFLKKSYGKNI